MAVSHLRPGAHVPTGQRQPGGLRSPTPRPARGPRSVSAAVVVEVLTVPRKGAGYGRRMAHIRIGDKSWKVSDDAPAVISHLESGQIYVADVVGTAGAALVISPALSWAVITSDEKTVDPTSSVF